MRRPLREFLNLVAAGMLVAASACASPTGAGLPDVELSLPTTVYAPGQVVELTVENNSARTWFATTGCNVGIERLVGGAWTPTYGVICVAALTDPAAPIAPQLWSPLTEIEPLAAVEMTWSLPLDAAVGLHRVRLRLHAGGDGSGEEVVLTSRTFTVFEVVGSVR